MFMDLQFPFKKKNKKHYNRFVIWCCSLPNNKFNLYNFAHRVKYIQVNIFIKMYKKTYFFIITHFLNYFLCYHI